MTEMLKDIPLDKKEAYISRYTPGLLYPISRKCKREEIGVPKILPFNGVDVWTGYEFSWLNRKGKPEIALLEFLLPCETENIIESKSMKLYLNSFNQSHFKSMEEVEKTISNDFSKALGTSVQVKLYEPEIGHQRPRKDYEGTCVDYLDITTDCYQVDPSLLQTASEQVDEAIYSHLLKSNCLVTKQPDWGSVWIHYVGKKIDHASFLKYIISFREHYEFNEQCIERIFMHISKYCKPEKLTVFGKYTRRGGLEIEPYRSNFEEFQDFFKVVRQ